MAATTRIYEDTYTGGQFVTGFTLTNAGTGYSGIPAVTIASPTVGGEDATGTAVLDATGLLPLDSITLDNAGSGYIAAPTVTVAAPPSGVTATATAGVSTGDTNAEGFQKYIITALEWSLSHSVAITFTGTGVTGATHLAAGSGKYSSTAITNAATQPGTAANADIVLTPGASCSGFVLLYLQKGAFV